MNPSPEEHERAQQLRQQAEEALRGRPVDLSSLPADDIQMVIHELQVHQAELTLQNDELRRIQGELEAAQKRYADLYHLAPVGYCTLDPQGRILEANQTLAGLLGVELKKLLQQPLGDYVERTDQDAYYLHRQRALESPERQVDVIRMVPAGGERLDVRLESVRLQGDGPRMAVALSDFTRQKAQEQKLAAYAAELAKLNREIQDFTFIASHDMQEPLRKIRLFSSLLLQQDVASRSTEETQNYLVRMESAAVRMQTMLEGLLAYSRITTKAQPYAQVNLFQIGTEVLAGFEFILHQNHGRVELGELPEIEADPHQMRLLFHVLLDNALKFTRPNVPPQVKIMAARQAAKGAAPEKIKISVADNGIGFEMSQVDQLFQPFHRLVGRSAYDGAGIGLAIARKIVERHGGRITAQSTPDQGSTFIVILPVKQ